MSFNLRLYDQGTQVPHRTQLAPLGIGDAALLELQVHVVHDPSQFHWVLLKDLVVKVSVGVLELQDELQDFLAHLFRCPLRRRLFVGLGLLLLLLPLPRVVRRARARAVVVVVVVRLR